MKKIAVKLLEKLPMWPNFQLKQLFGPKRFLGKLFDLLPSLKSSLKRSKTAFFGHKKLVSGNFLMYCFQFLKKLNLVPGEAKS